MAFKYIINPAPKRSRRNTTTPTVAQIRARLAKMRAANTVRRAKIDAISSRRNPPRYIPSEYVSHHVTGAAESLGRFGRTYKRSGGKNIRRTLAMGVGKAKPLGRKNPGRHTTKQKRMAMRIAGSERARGKSPSEAMRIGWATVNARGNKKGKRRMARKKLWGAALKAHLKKVRKHKKRRNPKRRRRVHAAYSRRRRSASPTRHRRRRRRNPAESGFGIVGSTAPKRRKRRRKSMASYARRLKRRIRKAKATTRTSKKARRRLAGLKAARTRKRRKAMKMAAARKGARKRKGSKMARRKSRRKSKGHRKSRKRVLAGKKAARTRARRRRGGGGKAHARRRRRRGNRFRGVKALVRSRRSIRWERRHGRGAARAYMRKHRMRSNPARLFGGIMAAAKKVLPVAGGFYGNRFLTNFLMGKIPVVSGLGHHAAPITSLLVALATKFLGKRVKFLAKDGVMLGMSLSVADVVLTTYVAPLAGFIGPVAPAAMTAPAATSGLIYDESIGEYVRTGDYVEVSDYVDTGAYAATGGRMEMGSLGAWSPKLLAGAVPAGVAAAVPIARQANVVDVPEWGPANEDDMYQGVFAKRGLHDPGY